MTYSKLCLEEHTHKTITGWQGTTNTLHKPPELSLAYKSQCSQWQFLSQHSPTEPAYTL